MPDAPARRRKDARPAEVLAAALEVFAAKGFAAARMEDIAARAGVSKGTVYLYFPSKQAVFEALVRQAILPNVERLEAMAAAYQGPTADLLRQAMALFPTLVRDPKVVTIPRLVIGEAGNQPEMADFYRREVVERGLGLIAGILRRGAERGEFRPLAPETVAKLWFAPLLLAVVWRTTFEPVGGTPLELDDYLRTHVDIMLRGLAPEGGTDAA